MIPAWLQYWLPLRAWVQDAPYKPDAKPTREELVFQMLREDIGFLAWIHNNLKLPPEADPELQKIWECKKRLYDAYAKLEKPGISRNPDAVKVRDCIDRLGIMPEAVEMATGDMGDHPGQEIGIVAQWLRKKVNRQFPELDVAPDRCLRVCRDYLMEHTKQPTW